MNGKNSVKSLLLLLLWGGTLVVFIAAARQTEPTEPNRGEFSAITTTQNLGTEWEDTCINQRIVITGTGMTNGTDSTTLLVAGGDIKQALAQVAGRRYSGIPPEPDSVTFTTDVSPSITITQPTHNNLSGFTFETNLEYTNQVTALVDNSGGQKTQRGLILYTTEQTTDRWTSIGKTTNGYVLAGSGNHIHTEVFTFTPPLKHTTDLTITAVVIDKDNDGRLMRLEAAAGDKITDTIVTTATHGDKLNITELILAQVLAGTEHITVTLESPLPEGVGDSLVLVGLNVSYRCEDVSNPGLYLPIIYRDFCLPFFDSFSSISSGWPVVDNTELKTEYIGGEYRMLTKNQLLHFATHSTALLTDYEIEVSAHWASSTSSGKGYGIIFGLASDDSHAYLFQLNSDRQEYRLLRFLDDDWWYYSNDTWSPATNTTPGWVFTDTISNTLNSISNPNQLRIIRTGSQIVLIVNDLKLETASDDSISEGQVGLSVQAYFEDPVFGSRDADVRFDNYHFTCGGATNLPSTASNLSIFTRSTGTLPSPPN